MLNFIPCHNNLKEQRNMIGVILAEEGRVPSNFYFDRKGHPLVPESGVILVWVSFFRRLFFAPV